MFVETKRAKRAERPTGGELLSLERLDRHPVETEIDGLARTTNIIVSGEADLEASIDAIDAMLSLGANRGRD